MTFLLGALVTALGVWLAVKAERGGAARMAHRLAGALFVVFILWGFSFVADLHAVYQRDNCDLAGWLYYFFPGCW